jgi:hypothetical protein
MTLGLVRCMNMYGSLYWSVGSYGCIIVSLVGYVNMYGSMYCSVSNYK